MGLEFLSGVGEGDLGLLAAGAQVGAVGCWWWVGEQVVDLSGDVPFQAADDFATGFALGPAFLGVVDGAGVVEHAVGGYSPEGVVGLAVPAPVESVPYGPSR